MFRFWKKKKDALTKELEEFLEFKIQNIELYKESLTHPSKKSFYNYQRLEFLGDAVLNLIIAAHVYKNYSNLSEGDLSKLRTKLVNKQILKEVALKLNLEKWINHQLTVAELEKSSVYCDVVESLTGAIYLDKGIEYAEKFVSEKIIKQLDDVINIEDSDYKSKIIQLAQKYKWQLKFHLKEITKVNTENIFKIELFLNGEKISEAKHYSKKQAEQTASKEALEKLNAGI